MHSLAGVEADDRLRKSEHDGNVTIVKAASEPRQYFGLFLRVDRNRAEGNRVPRCSSTATSHVHQHLPNEYLTNVGSDRSDRYVDRPNKAVKFGDVVEALRVDTGYMLDVIDDVADLYRRRVVRRHSSNDHAGVRRSCSARLTCPPMRVVKLNPVGSKFAGMVVDGTDGFASYSNRVISHLA